MIPPLRPGGRKRETVSKTAEFAPAFEAAVKAKRPALLELRLDPEAITPRASLSDIRENALKARPR